MCVYYKPLQLLYQMLTSQILNFKLLRREYNKTQHKDR
jgi:hypothetical protein